MWYTFSPPLASAQLSWLFSVLFQCHHCCLPQPHPPLHQQQTEECPSEVLRPVLTAAYAQGFKLYFGGEEMLCIHVCEVLFFTLTEVSFYDLTKKYPTCSFEVCFCRFRCCYFGVMCFFLACVISKCHLRHTGLSLFENKDGGFPFITILELLGHHRNGKEALVTLTRPESRHSSCG